MPPAQRTVEYIKSKLLLESQKNPKPEAFHPGHAFNSQPWRNQQHRKFDESKKCYHCGKPDHIKRFCPALRNKNNNPRYQQKKSYSYRGRDRQTRENTAEIESNDEQGRNTFHASINSPKDESEEGGSSMEQMTWLLDSGCSDHIVNDDKYFSIYRNLTKPVDIKEGDRFIIQALGIGTIDVNFKVDSKFVNVQIKKLLLCTCNEKEFVKCFKND